MNSTELLKKFTLLSQEQKEEILNRIKEEIIKNLPEIQEVLEKKIESCLNTNNIKDITREEKQESDDNNIFSSLEENDYKFFLTREKKVKETQLLAIEIAVESQLKTCFKKEISFCEVILISSYDKNALLSLKALKQKIDNFMTQMGTLNEHDRYLNHIWSNNITIENGYQLILQNLFALKESEKAREFNNLSITQTEILLLLWQEQNSFHKHKQTLSNFELSLFQKQNQEVLDAMILAEEAKPKPQG